MKKIIVRAVITLLVVITLALPVMAAGSVSISLSASSKKVNSGDSVTVTMSASVDSCGSGGVKISYNSGVFQLTSGQWSLSNAFMSDFSTGSADGVFAFESNKGISGKIFKFTLKVKDGAALGNQSVSVTFTADGKKVTKSVSINVACSHTYDNGCDASCNRCGATRTPKHSWQAGAVTKEATCSATGSQAYSCSVCGKKKTETLPQTEHTYDNSCDVDCNVCQQVRTIEHTFVWALEPTGHIETCSVCGVTQNPGEHTLETATGGDATGHGFKCSICGLIPEAQPHIYENDCDTTCDSCDYIRTVTHAYRDRWSFDEDGHWHACMICGEKTEMIPHVPGEIATEVTDQICTECGYVIQPAGNHIHSMAEDWLSNDVGHWYLCACLTLTEPEAHILSEGVIDEQAGKITYTCTVCGHVIEENWEEEPQSDSWLPEEISLKTNIAAMIAGAILVVGLGLGFLFGRIRKP